MATKGTGRSIKEGEDKGDDFSGQEESLGAIGSVYSLADGKGLVHFGQLFTKSCRTTRINTQEELTNIIIEKRTRAHFSDATGGPIQSRIVGRAWDEVILQMMIAAWKERRLPIANPVTENRAFPVLLSGSADHASARHLISLSGLPSCVIDSGSFLMSPI